MADSDLRTTRTYVYTLVNEFGEEGPPSPPSTEVTIGPNDIVRVSVGTPPVAEKYGIVAKRLYRSSTGDSGTVYRLVTEVPYEQIEIADQLREDELKEILPSEDWYRPPDDLTGIVQLSGGMLCGWRSEEPSDTSNRIEGQDPNKLDELGSDYVGPGILCVTEPYKAHAWPIQYRLRFDYPIVGVLPLDMGFVVFTKETAFFVAGTHPEQFQVRTCPSAPRCIGRKSIVSTGPVGYYASAMGPVMTDGMTFRYLLEATDTVTDPTRLFAEHVNEATASDTGGWGTGTAEDVRFNACSFAAITDNRLFMSFFYDGTPTGGTQGTGYKFALYEFDLSSREFPFLCGKWEYDTDITQSEEFLAGHLYFDQLTRTIYTLRGTEGGTMDLARMFPRASDSGLPSTCEWNSKEFTFQRPLHPGVIYIDFVYEGDAGGLAALKVKVQVIALHGDEESVVAEEDFYDDPGVDNVGSPHNWIRRCQVLAGPRSHRNKIKVTLPSGYAVTVRRIIIAENMQELVQHLPTA